MIETLSSSETSVLTRALQCIISDDGILHSHRRENLKSYEEYVDLQVHFPTFYGIILN
jgi:hypothetical protein